MTSSGPINDIWYRSLKTGLYNNLPNHDKLFIVRTNNNKGNYIFGAFKSSVDFYLYYRTLAQKEHHEVIPGSKPQKPRFDVDLDMTKLPKGENLIDYGDKIRDSIIISCSNVLSKLGVPLSTMDDFSIFTSSNDEKYSIHIILSSYCHNNNEEAKEFFYQVVENSKTAGIFDLADAIKIGALDGQVYKSLQNFRMYMSGKKVDGKIVRPKLYLPAMSLLGSVHYFPTYTTEKEKLKLFRKSCITDVVGCKHIPIILRPKPKFESNINLPDGYQDAITEAINNLYPGVFELHEEINTLITTKKRHSTYYCKICLRVHETVTPFITIDKSGYIKLFCYRAIEYARTQQSPYFVPWKCLGRLNLLPEVKASEKKELPVENKTKEKDDGWLIKPGEKVVFNHGMKAMGVAEKRRTNCRVKV